MFRETIQLIALISMLTSVNSLHMVRDAYRRPIPDIELMDLPADESSLNSPSSPSIRHRTIYNQPIGVDEISNDISQLNRPAAHRKEPPRALQELFSGPSTLDIRLEQQQQIQQRRLREQQEQQQQKQQQEQQHQQPHNKRHEESDQQQQQQHQSKRAPSTNNVGGAGANIGGSGGSGVGSTVAGSVKQNLAQVSHGITSQLMIRSPRGQRNYDVPQIGK